MSLGPASMILCMSLDLILSLSSLYSALKDLYLLCLSQQGSY